MNKKIHIIFLLMTTVLFFASCKEEDDAVEEYANWSSKNATFFTHLSDSVEGLLKAHPERTDWRRIKSWTKSDDTEGEPTDYIIVNVIAEGSEEEIAQGMPLFTDSVSVHYLGRLLPSHSYSEGLVFDQSYYGEFNEELCRPTSFVVNELIPGFSTALMHMHRGDYWRIYIPQQLGYGSSATSSIPAYSTLIFDIRLKNFK